MVSTRKMLDATKAHYAMKADEARANADLRCAARKLCSLFERRGWSEDADRLWIAVERSTIRFHALRGTDPPPPVFTKAR